MRKVLKVIAYVLGFLILIVAGFLAYVNFAPAPSYSPPAAPDLKVEATPERVAQGLKIASMQCIVCHTGEDGKLSGQQLRDAPAIFGKLYSANITQHPTKGIGNRTDGEIYALLRTGLRKDGSYVPVMPKFPLMADEDIYSVIAWLRSDDPRVQPSERIPPKSQFTLFTKGLLKFVFKPFDLPAQPIPLPDTTNQVAWGQYLANGAFTCFPCHSADFAKVNDIEPEKSLGFYGGGNPMLDLDGNLRPSANISPDPETGIGKWTEEQFVETVKYGRRPNGQMVRYPMLPHSGLTDNEVKAIYAYLRTVPPIHNEVKRD